MRLAYLDEAGVSNRRQEPYLVVAGVIVDPDSQWRKLESHIRSLAAQHAPDQDPYRFVFHAHELFHGSGYFDRRRWDKSERWAILDELASIPKKFNLPVALGWLRRSATEVEIEGTIVYREHNTPQFFEAWSHAAAFQLAAKQIEWWMRQNCKSELAAVIAEDRSGVKETIKFLHASYTQRATGRRSFEHDYFRSNHIVDTVHFAKKEESILLQIADVCAFCLKRRVMRKGDADRFYALLESQIVRLSEWMVSGEPPFQRPVDLLGRRARPKPPWPS